MTQPDQLLNKLDQRPTPFLDIPIQPANLAVLAVGVVVAALGAAELIAGEQHRVCLATTAR
jgi:hypothetical protein